MSVHPQENIEEEDFLDELIREYTEKNPDFPALLEAAERRRKKEQAIAAKRARLRHQPPSHRG